MTHLECQNRRTRNVLRPVIWVTVFLPLVVACSTLELPQYKPGALESYSNLQIQEGLGIATRTMTERQESEKYFGLDLVSANVLPVHLVIENRSSSASYLIEKDSIFLRIGDVSSIDGATTGSQLESGSPGEEINAAGAALIFLPLMILGSKLSSDSAVVKRNLAANELQTRTLSPGDSTHGFVYFQLPEEGAAPSESVITLEALERPSNLRLRFIFSANLGEKRE